MKKKKCSGCGKSKSLDLFVKYKKSIDGTHNQCKECRKEFYYTNKERILKRQKEYNRKNAKKISERKKKYGRTKRGKILQILKNIQRRCENSKDTHYHRYGGRGITANISYENLSFLWDRDKAMFMERPSIDRINVNGDYELGNCQFIEFSENSIKENRKKIKQMTKNGSVVKIWNSISEAERNGFQHGNIVKCCQGKRPTHKGFSWKYLN